MANDLVIKANDLFRNGKYKEALKLLNGLEGNDRNAPSVLLMLLCSYQVINTEELLKKASNSLRSVELFARRPELNELAVQLRNEDNALVSHMMEYCFISLLLAGVKESDILGMSEKPIYTVNKKESAFTRMDEEEWRDTLAAQYAGGPYDFDPIEELDDIRVKFKSALDNPEAHAGSAGVGLALDLLTFFARSDEYFGGSTDRYEDSYSFHDVPSHDYWKDKPRRSEFHKGLNDSSSERESAFDKTGIGPVPQTEEEKIARLNELLLLISKEEESVMNRQTGF